MKKKKNSRNANSDDGEIFPVDTLGIPILVDVIDQADLPDAVRHSPGSMAESGEAAAETLNLRPVPLQENPTGSSVEVRLDQVTEQIASSVTGEIMALIEPLVRDKVSLALRMYEDELLKLPDEENDKKPKSGGNRP